LPEKNKNSTMNEKGIKRRRFIKWAASGLGLAAVGAIYWPRRWRYIVIHHSAGDSGDIAFLQQVHRDRQRNDPVDAIPYHYVIGNGRGIRMGEVASDWRKESNLWGAHVSGNNSDRNFRGIGICMIGNFEAYQVPEPQYQALLSLCRSLMAQYPISLSKISGHGLTPGESTLCPGKFFPMDRLIRELAALT
jgi:N-acetylmuramoyl-L-alanine amidase